MVHGKQIKDTSIKLVKVDPSTGQLLTLVGTSKIQQNAAPTVGIDLVNKDYVDGLVTGLDFKQSVRVASNGTSINIAIAPATIDGVTLAPGERVLLKDQAPATDNGIYDFNGTGNAMTRSTDANTNAEVTAGMFMFVEEGTWADTGWVLSTNNPIILGTTLLTFTQFSAAGVITASNGLNKLANDIRLGGNLSMNTTVDGVGNTYNMAFDNMLNFDVVALNTSITGSTLTTIDGGASTIALDTAVGIDLSTTADINLTSSGNIVNTTTDFNTIADSINNTLAVSYDTTVADLLFSSNLDMVPNDSLISVTDLTTGDIAKMELSGATKKVTMSYYEVANTNTTFIEANDTVSRIGTDEGNNAEFFKAVQGGLTGGDTSTNNTMIITDGISSKGLVYKGNYNANFTQNSLVDKRYVDATVASGVTADNGLTKTLANIQLGGPLIQNTSINGAAGLYSLDLINLSTFTAGADEVAVNSTYGSLTMNLANNGIILQSAGYDLANNTVGGNYDINTTGGNYTATMGNGTYTVAGAGDILLDATSGDSTINGNFVNLNAITSDINLSALVGAINAGAVGITLTSSLNAIEITSAANVDTIATADITDVAVNYNGTISGSYTATANDMTLSSVVLTTIDSAIVDIQATSTVSIGSANNVTIDAAGGGIALATNTGGPILLTSNGTLALSSTGDTTITSAAASGVLTTADAGNLYFNMYGTPQAILNNGGNNSLIIADAVNSKGLLYATDYSANFTPESLVSKRYVDDAIFNAADYANNGITKTGIYFQLGGPLLQNTNIDGVINAYSLTLTDLNLFNVTATNIQASVSGDYTLTGSGGSGYSLNVGSNGISNTTTGGTYSETANTITNTVSVGMSNVLTGLGSITSTSTNGANIGSTDVSAAAVVLSRTNGTDTSNISLSTTINQSVTDGGVNTTTHWITSTSGTINSSNGIDSTNLAITPTSGALSNSGHQLTISTSEASIGAGANVVKLVTTAGIAVTNNGSNNYMVITDGSASKGLVYAADYAANFTPESLISKRYVDDALTAGMITASNGLTKTVNDIQLGGALTANTNITGAFGLNLGTAGSKLTQLTSETTSNVTLNNTAAGDVSSMRLLATSAVLDFTDTGVTRTTARTNATTVTLDAASLTNSNDSSVVVSTTNIDITTTNGVDTVNIGTDITESFLGAYNGGLGAQNYFSVFKAGQTVANNSTDNSIIITDGITTKGAVYAADYSANFTPESLVSKRYVDANTGGVSTLNNKIQAASVTTASGQQIGAAITSTPKNDSYVQVFVNGVKCTVGDGVATADVYFAAVGFLATPLAISAISAGDVLVRGSGLGYDTDATDIVEYDYQA
jgi:hypothetical protein